MTVVTFPNGDTYSDAGETANDMRNGGFRTNLLPMISDTITVANSAITAAAAAVPAATTATAGATTATTQAAIAVAAANTAASIVTTRDPSEVFGLPPLWSFLMTSAAGVPSGIVSGTSGKWVRSQAGVWTFVQAGTAPSGFELTTGRARGVRVEGAATNPILYPSDFSNAAWTKSGSGTVTADAKLAPDGTMTADLLSDTDSGSDAAYWQQSFTVANDTSTRCISVFLAQGTAAASEVRAFLLGGTTPLSSGVVGKVTWSTRAVSGSAGAAFDEDANGFGRLSVPITNNGTGNTTLLVRVYPATNATGVTGTAYAWQAQIDPGASPSSIIPGTSSAVTRAADSNLFTLSRAGGMPAEGTLYVEFEPDFAAPSGTNQTVTLLDDGTTNNFIGLLRWESNQGLLLYVRSGGVTQVLSASAAITNRVVHKAAVSWKAGSVGLSLNGATAVADTSVTLPTGITTARLGHGLTSEPLNGWLRRVDCYPRWQTAAIRNSVTA